MYADLGDLIRENRESAGATQSDLADSIGVTRKTVRDWERGLARPRRQTLSGLATAINVDETVLLAAGRYQTASKETLAVRPRTAVLPLSELPEDRFEDLCVELVASMFPSNQASKYGGRGDKQDGIDILVVDGSKKVATGQCKRYKQFGAEAVRKAIRAVTIEAPKNYLFLSRPNASPSARQAAAEYLDWELWDGADISRAVRNLPLDRAVRLVDVYFPGHREAFLGVASPSPWLPAEEYFNSPDRSTFHHDWELAGRQVQLEQLTGAAFGESATVAFLSGAGGTGKTRLLKALAQTAPSDAVVRFLPGDSTVGLTDFELLPANDDLTVVVDDAHEKTVIGEVVAGVWRRNRDARIVLASRPYGLRYLQATLEQHSLLPDDPVTVELGDLDIDAAAALAREALGASAPESIVRWLAALTYDSPLATVVGGVLIKEGRLNPQSLATDQNVRSQIMRGFSDALTMDREAHDQSTRRAVLNALAAVQPFRASEQAARQTLSMIVDKPYDEIHVHIRGLEAAGVLRCRKDSFRIVPDLLGDVILAESVYDPASALDTGYLERVQSIATGRSRHNLFVNASRVDWQVRTEQRNAPSLVDSLWVGLQRRIETGGVRERRECAELVASVAYFQPERALAVTQWLMENRIEPTPDERPLIESGVAFNYSWVLDALPPILRQAAMSVNTLADALSQLWTLAQSDTRPTNQYPDHPIRILRELTEFSATKPLAYIHRIIDVVSRWFRDDQGPSPFDVLEPVVQTEGEDTRSRGYTVTFRPFALDPVVVMEIRQRVIDLALEEMTSTDPRRAIAAVRLLGSAIRYPSGRFGREVSARERDSWTPGFVETINRLGDAATTSAVDPLVYVAVREAVHWHLTYSMTATQRAAEEIIASLPTSAEALLALVIHDTWGRLIRYTGHDYQVLETKRADMLTEVVNLLSPYDDQEVIDLLTKRLRIEREAYAASSDGNPGPVVMAIVKARPSCARLVLDHIRSTSHSAELNLVLPDVLSALAEEEPQHALSDARDLAASSPEYRQAVAQALGWKRGGRALYPGELQLLLGLASDDDLLVRRSITRAAQLLVHTNRPEATQLLGAIRFADAKSLADDVFATFSFDSGISWDSFTTAEIDLMRRDLVTLSDIDVHWISTALATRSATDPKWVVQLLKDRIERAERDPHDYQPVPFYWSTPLRVRDTEQFFSCLRELLHWIAAAPESWVRREMGGGLFQAIAQSYDSPVLKLLGDAIDSGSSALAHAAVAALA